jgi:hypothetical protein
MPVAELPGQRKSGGSAKARPSLELLEKRPVVTGPQLHFFRLHHSHLHGLVQMILTPGHILLRHR